MPNFAKMEQKSILIQDTRDWIDEESKLKILQTFAFEPRHPQLIRIETHEFSAVCPGTGLPDIGYLTIEYIPNRKCVELKSLKLYLFSYRNEQIFQEPVTDLIFDHLWKVLEPHYLKVSMKYNTRGGIDTTVIVEKGEKNLLNP